jgi:hypothetical protein
MQEPKPLNPGLSTVHLIALTAYGAIWILLSIAGSKNGWDIVFGGGFFLVLTILHWYGRKGARLGTRYGRNISRTFGIIWLFGFPIGTALGIYMLIRASDGKWKAAVPALGPAAAGADVSAKE